MHGIKHDHVWSWFYWCHNENCSHLHTNTCGADLLENALLEQLGHPCLKGHTLISRCLLSWKTICIFTMSTYIFDLTLLICFCLSLLTISSMISPVPLTNLWHDVLENSQLVPPSPHLCLPVSGSYTRVTTLCCFSNCSLVIGTKLLDGAFICVSAHDTK